MVSVCEFAEAVRIVLQLLLRLFATAEGVLAAVTLRVCVRDWANDCDLVRSERESDALAVLEGDAVSRERVANGDRVDDGERVPRVGDAVPRL